MTTGWDEMTTQWQKMYAAASGKDWFGTHATAFAAPQPPNATALSELWRSWTSFGNSLGSDPLSPTSARDVGDALRRMAEGPRLADVGAPERLLVRITERWLAVQSASRDYESVVAGAWAEANTRFAADMAKRFGTGKDIPDAKHAQRLWLETTNQVLLETHRSEKFLDAQRRLLREGLDFMLVQREFVESLAEPAGLPTRTEIDEVHRSVYELKRRVRTLEKQLGDNR